MVPIGFGLGKQDRNRHPHRYQTNCCIRATATDAHNLDYNVYVVADCVATNSDVVNQVHLEDIRSIGSGGHL